MNSISKQFYNSRTNRTRKRIKPHTNVAKVKYCADTFWVFKSLTYLFLFYSKIDIMFRNDVVEIIIYIAFIRATGICLMALEWLILQYAECAYIVYEKYVFINVTNLAVYHIITIVVVSLPSHVVRTFWRFPQQYYLNA